MTCNFGCWDETLINYKIISSAILSYEIVRDGNISGPINDSKVMFDTYSLALITSLYTLNFRNH